MSSSNPHQDPPVDEQDGSEPEMLDEDEIAEVAADDDDGDVAMDSDDEGAGAAQEGQEEIHLQNDSIAYFDAHKDSVFAIAQHPTFPSLIATGGSEGEADDAPGKGYVFSTSAAPSRPVLPASYSGDERPQNTRLEPLFEIDGHTDSINALTFTLPSGEFLLSGGMDGQLRAYSVSSSPESDKPRITFLSSSAEVSEINWLAPCPSPANPNTVALGASDGSVWVYALDNADPSNALQIVQSYFLHTAPCTAGAWTPDGSLLATVSEDGSLYVYDVFGLAAAKGLATENGQTVVGLTDADQRFAVEGGLYSVAVNPTGAFVAVGGAGGAIKVVSLPRVSEPAAATGKGKGGAASRRGGASAASQAASPQAGTILASLGVQSDGIETLAFAPAPNNLLAAGSVDGSIAVFDAGRGFAVRKHIRAAHEDFSTVKVEFVRGAAGPAAGWLLTSCGMDGVVRRWDLRGATPGAGAEAGAAGLVKEWKGHRGDGEGGGVLGFVQGETGERVVTAGDDGVVLVFEA
ncbi:WD40 repeat-like protein [Coniochaeta hoffmannii]|uniref:WD40 repeat-like protein n=1 Tax=Coniochaeta hoffmannii TaxID=91930 RepID=A0AA38RDK5_9PEZI|nr:WD40 repeat-like protein [Coniochaeta hoffmannii]